MSAHDAIVHALQFYTRNELLSDACATAVLVDLKVAGYAVVELPKPDSDEPDRRLAKAWMFGDHDTVELDCFKRIHSDGRQYDATEARDFAAALLAAADAAEAAE